MTCPGSAGPESEGPQTDRLTARLERERRARREAEEIGERSTRALYDRQGELELLSAVASAANQAASVQGALHATVQMVCAHARYPVGHGLLVGESGMLHTSGAWHLERPERVSGFTEASKAMTFAPGQGLPGRVLASGHPAWIEDLDSDPNLPRRTQAREGGLRSAFAFPILIEEEVVGVIELLSERCQAPDPARLAVMAQVGTRLGRVVERDRAQAAVLLLADELERRNSELARSNDALQTFAQVASHDLGEPLRTVGGFVTLLRDRYGDTLDDPARQFLDYASSGVARMQVMLRDILEYARAGAELLITEEVDAGELTRDAIAALPLPSDDLVEVGALPRVRGDATKLTRVLQNLIANAVKFVPAGIPPRVLVDAERDGEEWVLSVTDNGPGVAAEDSERIFEMFQRVGGGEGPPGTGIGLAVCAKIISAHGGRIWVEPGHGEGSVFRFTLPVG